MFPVIFTHCLSDHEELCAAIIGLSPLFRAMGGVSNKNGRERILRQKNAGSKMKYPTYVHRREKCGKWLRLRQLAENGYDEIDFDSDCC